MSSLFFCTFQATNGERYPALLATLPPVGHTVPFKGLLLTRTKAPHVRFPAE